MLYVTKGVLVISRAFSASVQVYKSALNRNLKLLNLLKSLPKEMEKNAMRPIVRNWDKPKNRVSIKDCRLKNTASIATLQVLGSGARGCPKCAYLFTDQISYIFNCGEGTQRLAYEHRKKLSKIEHIFITNPVWSNIGGLLGLALTMQEMGVPKLVLHGPKKLINIFNYARKLFFFNNLEVEIDSSDEYKDNVIEAKTVKIPNTNFYSYICKLTPKPGALCLEKCLEAGVPPGPILGQLKSGNDVTLKDGRIVKSTDVILPEEKSPVFIIVDCASEEAIDDFVKLDIFKDYQQNATLEENEAYAVIHFSPKDVVEHPKYLEWINLFPSSTYHLMLNEMNVCPGYLSAHEVQHRLNLINSKMFPLINKEGFQLVDDVIKKRKLDHNDCNVATNVKKMTNGHTVLQNGVDSKLLKARTMDVIYLRPKEGFDTSNQLTFNAESCLNVVQSMENFSTVLNEYKKKYDAVADDDGHLSDSFGDNTPRVLFTGTGSCIPNKTRNTSGILWFVNDDNLILMDCGEGTSGQLVRFFGCDKINSILIRIKAIYISHMHADHYLGIIALVLDRKRAFLEQNLTFEPVMIFAPNLLEYWLNLYSAHYEHINVLYKLYLNSSFIMEDHKLQKSEENKLLESLQLKEINTVLVEHCQSAFGVSFVDKNDNKITYSGDTMPCDQLVRLGYESDLLIHEATMEDDLVSEAKIKFHSTITQAIEQGRKMQAKQILLTHFSQRYAKMPRFTNDLHKDVAIAFDNMIADLNDLKKMPIMYPVLLNLFAEYQELLESRATKRQVRAKIVANNSS